MVEITQKNYSLRKAIAQASVHLSEKEALNAIVENRVPKGNVFEISRAAGLFAAKRTSDVIPDCHPLPIEYTSIRHRIEDMTVLVEVEVHTIYKTGVEVEAMHAASVVALTIYDMLKPLDKGIAIKDIRLLSKKGGKSDFTLAKNPDISAMVVVCSDSISRGEKEDRAGKVIVKKLESMKVKVVDYSIISDDFDGIQNKAKGGIKDQVDLIIFTGGTGLSPRDQTPEAIQPLIQKSIPGVEEAIRSYGQYRTPFSMLSRTVVGLAESSVIMALPGSTAGAGESMDAVFPHLLHVFHVMKGGGH